MITTVGIRANRFPRNAHHRIALIIAEVFVGHDGGIAALLAATVRLDPKVLHDTRLGRDNTLRGCWCKRRRAT